MRNFITKIVYILLALLCFTSCKKDDDSSSIDDLRIENRKSIGISAEDLLSDDIFSKLTVEIVYADPYKPSEESIESLRIFLNERLNKPSGINIIETSINAPSGAPFTIEEIKTIEDINRENYTEGDDISIYLFFSNGKSSNDSNISVTLGSAYFNTSIVIYQKTIIDLANSNPNIGLIDLESSTMQHEIGHLLGLVNIQDDDIHTVHQDPSHSKHCLVEDCLMYFESNTFTDVVNRFAGGRGVAELDPLCIADLQAKGGL